MYEYLDEIRRDAEDYIMRNHISLEACKEDYQKTINDLYNEMVDDDDVTGGKSGKYFENAWAAESALAHNWDIIWMVLENMEDSEIVETLGNGAEHIDVLVRQYALPLVLDNILEDYLDEHEDSEYEKLCREIGVGSAEFYREHSDILKDSADARDFENVEHEKAVLDGFLSALEVQNFITEDRSQELYGKAVQPGIDAWNELLRTSHKYRKI